MGVSLEDKSLNSLLLPSPVQNWGHSIQNQKAKEVQETDTRLGLTALNPAYSSLMHHHSKEMSQGLHHDWNHNINDSHGRLFI